MKSCHNRFLHKWSRTLNAKGPGTFQIIQKIVQIIALVYYIYQLNKFGTLIELWFNTFKTAPSSPFSPFSNTHHEVTDLANSGMVKIQKLEYLENRT